MADLWILDAGEKVMAADIERGCQAGVVLILKRGFTVDQAYEAVLSRANNERHNAKAASAWDAAEDAAFAELYGDRDDWPDDAVLGIA
jgi:hypothetical protein